MCLHAVTYFPSSVKNRPRISVQTATLAKVTRRGLLSAQVLESLRVGANVTFDYVFLHSGLELNPGRPH